MLHPGKPLARRADTLPAHTARGGDSRAPLATIRGRAGAGFRVISGSGLEAATVVTSLEDIAVVGEAIEHRRRHLGIAEDPRPLPEGEVRGDDDRGALVEAADEVEQELPA